VEFNPQKAGGFIQTRQLVVKDIRPVQTHFKQSAKPLNGSSAIPGQLGQHGQAKPIMGVCGRHSSPSLSSKFFPKTFYKIYYLNASGF
jgi:hypothetical protein